MNISKLPLFLFIGISIFLFSACDDDCEESSLEFTWSQNRSIEIVPDIDSVMVGDSIINLIGYQVVDGQDILFEYTAIGTTCDPDIADGNGILDFSMAIPADSTITFSYVDSEIIATSAFVNIITETSSSPYHFVEEGTITGTRIDDNSWQVSVDIITTPQEYGELFGGDEPQAISIDTIFTLE